MALWVCRNDGVQYSVGARACPECGSTEHVEQDSPEHEALLAEKASPRKPAVKQSGEKPGEAAKSQ